MKAFEGLSVQSSRYWRLFRMEGMVIKTEIDWSLYLVTDEKAAKGRELDQVVESTIVGGVSVVQYRAKDRSTREMLDEAQRLALLCRRRSLPFIVNDRVDVALAVSADGVHLGQDDMPAVTARRLLGERAVIGVTVHDGAELDRAVADGADYVSIAPVFATDTKPDHRVPLGLAKTSKLARRARDAGIPAVAIAGIDLVRAASVMACGVDGICVVSAIFGSSDPERAAVAFRRIVDSARNSRSGSP